MVFEACWLLIRPIWYLLASYSAYMILVCFLFGLYDTCWLLIRPIWYLYGYESAFRCFVCLQLLLSYIYVCIYMYIYVYIYIYIYIYMRLQRVRHRQQYSTTVPTNMNWIRLKLIRLGIIIPNVHTAQTHTFWLRLQPVEFEFGFSIRVLDKKRTWSGTSITVWTPVVQSCKHTSERLLLHIRLTIRIAHMPCTMIRQDKTAKNMVAKRRLNLRQKDMLTDAMRRDKSADILLAKDA